MVQQCWFLSELYCSNQAANYAIYTISHVKLSSSDAVFWSKWLINSGFLNCKLPLQVSWTALNNSPDLITVIFSSTFWCMRWWFGNFKLSSIITVIFSSTFWCIFVETKTFKEVQKPRKKKKKYIYIEKGTIEALSHVPCKNVVFSFKTHQ